MSATWTGIFWVSLAGLAWTYLGYPLLLLARRAAAGEPSERAPIRPFVSVIVPAHDEAATIEAKLRETFGSEWPADRIEVVVVSDGSTDATGAIVRGFGDPRVRLMDLDRAGKAAALNAGAAAARGEVLVFTDANAALSGDAIARLVEWMADPDVGAVAGRKRVRRGGPAGGATAEGEGLYWRIEDRLKRLESETGSVVAADGGLYAVRRELYEPIEDPAQADDMAISMRVVLRGARLVYAPRAVAVEDAPAGAGAELRRKVRVTNHSLRALLLLGPALWTSGFYTVQLVSHKLLRHLGPFFLIPLAVASVALAGSAPVYLAAAIGQGAFYGLALAGLALRRARAGRSPILAAPYWFCLVQIAALAGVLSVLAGRRIQAWTPRGGAPIALDSVPSEGGSR